MTIAYARSGLRETLAWVRREGTALAIGGLTLAVSLVWEWRDGGYAPRDWLPGALFLLGLLVTVLVTVPAATRPPRAVAVAVVSLAAFTIWNACSVAWAGDPGIAWDGTNRTALYLFVFALFALLPWPRRTVAFLLGAYVVGAAVLGALAFFRQTGSDPFGAFVLGRLAVPIEYANGNAALYLAAVWPALYLAARRESPPLVRGLTLAATGVLIDLSLLSQSRASLVAVPAVALAYLIVVPARLRLIAVAVPLVAVTAASAPTLIDTFQAVHGNVNAPDAVAAARTVILRTALALFFAGVLLGLLDRRFVLPRRVVRLAGVTLLTLTLLAAAITTVAVAAFGDPIDRVTVGWNDFRSDKESDVARSHFVSGLGSKRYDLWRVALIEFRDRPIGGIGSDNFAAPYLRLRQTREEPLYPHGLPFRLASQTGAVGVLLFVAWLGGAVVAFRAAGRARSRDAQALACSALALTSYWLVQGSVDWFWEIPALGAPAVACLGLAFRTTDDAPRVHGRAPGWLIAAVVAAALLPAASFTLPWLAVREVETAASTWFEGPQRAFDRLDLARRLNPLSDDADVITGVIARRLGDSARERAAYLRVVERNPANWYAWLELALIEAGAHRRQAALDAVRRARASNPREPLLARVERRILSGETIDRDAIERVFAERLQIFRRGR